jgi:serine/threonine protein kinase
MYRLSVVGMPSDGSITKAWLRTPDGERYYRLELGIMCDLQNTGLVPDLIDFGEEPTTMWVRVVALDPLAEWLEQNGSAEARAEMRDRIRVQLRALHRAGVCHRDVHLHNVVVDEAGVPRFIDFELAARVDPRSGCFDLEGPASGVPVPAEHADGGLKTGVWWNQWPPALGSWAMARTFGPL